MIIQNILRMIGLLMLRVLQNRYKADYNQTTRKLSMHRKGSLQIHENKRWSVYSRAFNDLTNWKDDMEWQWGRPPGIVQQY